MRTVNVLQQLNPVAGAPGHNLLEQQREAGLQPCFRYRKRGGLHYIVYCIVHSHARGELARTLQEEISSLPNKEQFA